MSHHTPSPRRPPASHRRLPMGRARLEALAVALDLVATLQQLGPPRGCSHIKDHVTRAADNTVLRLAEASGRTMGNRTQHLEAAYSECQEVLAGLLLLEARGTKVPAAAHALADRLGGLVYGLLRADARARQG